MTSLALEQSRYLTTLEEVANLLQKAQTNIKKCPKARLTEGFVQARLKTIDDYWDTFKSSHYSLTRCTPKEQRGGFPYFLNEEFYKVEELYLSMQADLRDLILQSQQKGLDTSLSKGYQDSQLAFVKLPRIKLPTFSGKYEDWPSYQDMFLALVHNTSMSDVQKLHYLKTSVTGEAEILLRNVPITENNYSRAWNLLKERFGNTRMITNTIFQRLFGQKKLSTQSPTQIKAILDMTLECLSSLNNLKINTDSWDPVIIFLVSQKLDTESLKDWEEHAYKENSEDVPTWEDMKKFLEFKFRTLELVTPTVPSGGINTTYKAFHVTIGEPKNKGKHFSPIKYKSSRVCAYCKTIGHYIQSCQEFIELPVDIRHSFVRENSLCFNCFLPNHKVYELLCKRTCRLCNRRHHCLLHQPNKVEKKIRLKEIPDHNVNPVNFKGEQPDTKVLLPTAQVNIKARNGKEFKLRALIDQGSEVSFISAGAIERLGLPITNINTVVSGVQEDVQFTTNNYVDIFVKSRFKGDKDILVKAYVLDKISSTLPSENIKINHPDLKTIPLADPSCFTPGEVEILLGADVFPKIIEDGLMRMTNGIVAQKTCFGWMISGQYKDI